MALPPIAITPFGCRHCGIPKRTHYQQWKPPAGWHSHVAPTDSQILTRMKARRAARPTNTPKDEPMTQPSAPATIAALDALMTKHPDLGALPISWTVRLGGDLHANPSFGAEGSHDVVRALALAFGAETSEYETHIPATGEKFAAVAIRGAQLAGATVYSTGYAPLAVEADVAKVGA